MSLHSVVLSAALAAVAVLSTACGGGSEVQAAPLAKTPRGLPEMPIPDDNPMTADKVHLGKMLFFDKRLSSNGEMACQSCHMHEKGWTDGKRFSQKVDGTMNTRNSPSLYNVGYQNEFYWDGRAPTMEANVTAAWKGHMGGDPDAMAKTLAGIGEYEAWFQKAFKSAPTGENVVHALTSFVRSLRSGGSDYDYHQASQKATPGSALSKRKLSAAAVRGMNLFTQRCGMCHMPPLFTDLRYHNIGAGEKPDPGRGKVEPDNKAAQGAFKTPSLRSVSKTAPYFHDGSKATLREAVAFMYQGGKKDGNEHWDPLLGAPKAMHDAEDEATRNKNIDDIVEFLKSLASDEEFTAPELP